MGWLVGWLVGFFGCLLFFFCPDVLVDLVLQKVLGLSSSPPSFFWSGNLYLVEDKLRDFFLPPFTEVWCQGNNVSVITTVINCLLKQRVCYLWEEIVSKTFASWYMVLVPSGLTAFYWSGGELKWWYFTCSPFAFVRTAQEQITWSFSFDLLQLLSTRNISVVVLCGNTFV